jgi:hypothetical protein
MQHYMQYILGHIHNIKIWVKHIYNTLSINYNTLSTLFCILAQTVPSNVKNQRSIINNQQRCQDDCLAICCLPGCSSCAPQIECDAPLDRSSKTTHAQVCSSCDPS